MCFFQKSLMALVISALCNAAFADGLLKCKDPKTGKVVYSDVFCKVGQKETYKEYKPVNTFSTQQERREIANDKFVEASSYHPKSGAVVLEDLDKKRKESKIAAELLEKSKRKRAYPVQSAGGAPVQPASEAPAFSASCDSSGCWDSNGKRYNSTNDGTGNMWRQDGKFCQNIGGQLQCN